MKKKSKIVTDPAELARICASQPKVSASDKRRSILAQNKKPVPTT